MSTRYVLAIVFTMCIGLVCGVSAQAPDAKDWYNTARRLVQAGEKAKALEAYDRSVALDSTNAIAWANRGTLLLNSQQYEAALKSYDRALALHPTDAYVYCSRATVFNRTRQPELALQSANKAITYNAGFWGAWLNKAEALEALGRTEEAGGCRQQAHELARAAKKEQ